VTHDDVLSRVNAYDPADLLPASDLVADLGHWEWAAWMRLRAAAPGRPVRVKGEAVAFAATRDSRGDPWLESFPEHVHYAWNLPVYRWHGPGAGRWVCLDPFTGVSGPTPVEVPPDVRRALEAAAAEAVRRVLIASAPRRPA
jgi:hypothetical protein